MTRDEIIRLAVECQLVTTGNRDGIYMDALERFAHAVAQAELDALKVGVPDGWQLVPVVPTDEMLNSVRREMAWCNPVWIFLKMLKAAPKPGEGNG